VDRPSPGSIVQAGDGVTLLGRQGRAESVRFFDSPDA